MNKLLGNYVTEEEYKSECERLKYGDSKPQKPKRPGRRERAEAKDGQKMPTGKRGSRMDAYDRMMRNNH